MKGLFVENIGEICQIDKKGADLENSREYAKGKPVHMDR
jgi:hypothetical protein